MIFLLKCIFKQIFEAFPIPPFDLHSSSRDLPKRVPVVKVQFSCRFNFFLSVYTFDTHLTPCPGKQRDVGVKQVVGVVAEGKERAFNRGGDKNRRVNLWHGDKIQWCITSDIW